jgi:hypothetical protein
MPVYSCSKTCQADDWKDGHKKDCQNLVHPPFAKEFEVEERPNAPWPVHPVFGFSKRDGLGIWVSAGSNTMSAKYVITVRKDALRCSYSGCLFA